MPRHYLVHAARNYIRPWLDSHGANFREVTAQEVLKLCPQFSSEEEFVQLSDQVAHGEPPEDFLPVEETTVVDERPPEMPFSATPAAEKLAETFDLDVFKIPGTGMNGTVTKPDVEAYLEQYGLLKPEHGDDDNQGLLDAL